MWFYSGLNIKDRASNAPLLDDPRTTGSTRGGIVSVWARKEPERRVQEQALHLGAAPKEVYSRVGKKGKEGEEVNKRCVIKAVSMLGTWGLFSKRESLEHTSEVFQLNDEEVRIFSNHFSLHGWLKASGTLCCCCSVAQLHPTLTTPWTAAWQTSLSFTISWGLLKLMSIESVLPSKHTIFFALFSSCFQSLLASGSFPVNWLVASGGQSIRTSASASVLPMNIQDWLLLGLTGWNSLQSKGLSRVFSNTTVQKHQFFGTQLSLWSNSHIHTWLLEKPPVSSVARSCPTLCNTMNCCTPGLPVHHQPPELAQTHVHWVYDAIQPSHPLSSFSPTAFNLSEHQGLFQWVRSLHQVVKVLELQLQHQSFQWIFRNDFL